MDAQHHRDAEAQRKTRKQTVTNASRRNLFWNTSVLPPRCFGKELVSLDWCIRQ